MPRRRGVQVYAATVRHAALSHEFGQQMAQRWFGLSLDDLKAKFGTYSRGPRKGLCRGTLVWVKVTEGGWSYDLQCVIKPGTLCADVVTNEDWSQRLCYKSTSDLLNTLPRVKVNGQAVGGFFYNTQQA